MKYARLYISLFLLLVFMNGRSQFISGAMQFAGRVDPKDSNSLSFNYSNFFYIKDYEYFNKIQTGYTIFGNWHYPRLSLQPNQWLKLEAGFLLQKEYGDRQLDKALPVFMVQLQQKNFQYRMGVLESNQSHGLIEPLMSYDKVMERPLEEGMQFIFRNKRFATELWLDWERRQKVNSDFSEELTGGFTATLTLTKPENPWQVKLPLQVIVPHKGGQLDSNNSVVSSVINHAKGLWVEWNNPDKKNWMRQIRVDGYHVGFHHEDNTLYPFNKGHGVLINFFLRSKWDIAFLASYWKGNKYIAPKGGGLYQSLTTFGPGTYTEPERQLLILNMLFEKQVIPGFFMDTRFSPYFDLKNHLFEYAFNIYLSYRFHYRVGALKHFNSR